MLKNQIHQLLSICTHLNQTDKLNLQILEAVKNLIDWQTVINQAEEHGMAPLLNFHLRKSGAEIPPEGWRDLTALSLRHRLINQVRTNLLIKLAPQFQQAGIPFLVLKGMALAHLLYASPDLRPMKDMDLLVQHEDCNQVTQLLLSNGFKQHIDVFFHPSELHFPTFTKEVEGFRISIEVHHRLLPEKNYQFWGYLGKFKLPHQLISLSDDVIVETISKEEFLYHLCKHTFFSYHNLEPIKMIWVADICNFAEKFVDDIDWGFLKKQYPLVQHTLAALNEIFPLSDHLILNGEIQPRLNPEKVIRTYQGWPGIPLKDVKKQDYWQWFKDTVFPSNWVLFLYYGNGRFRAKWYNWLKHVFNLIAITKQHLKIRFNTKHK